MLDLNVSQTYFFCLNEIIVFNSNSPGHVKLLNKVKDILQDVKLTVNLGIS